MATDITIMGGFTPFHEERPVLVWNLLSRKAGEKTLWLDINTGTRNNRETVTLFFERLTVDECDDFLTSMVEAQSVLRDWNDARRVAQDANDIDDIMAGDSS